MYLAALIASFCAIQSVVADASFSKDTKDCKINGNKDTPGISCECKTSDGNWVSCTAGIGSNFVNDNGKLESRPGGSAPATCTEFNLKDNVLGADCGGTRIALINLGNPRSVPFSVYVILTTGIEDVCSVHDGKLVCSKKDDTRQPTTTPSASKATSTNYSTEKSTPDTIAASGLGQSTASSQIETTTAASSTPISQTSVSATESTSGTSGSTDATNSCGCGCGMARRSRIMGR